MQGRNTFAEYLQHEEIKAAFIANLRRLPGNDHAEPQLSEVDTKLFDNIPEELTHHFETQESLFQQFLKLHAKIANDVAYTTIESNRDLTHLIKTPELSAFIRDSFMHAINEILNEEGNLDSDITCIIINSTRTTARELSTNNRLKLSLIFSYISSVIFSSPVFMQFINTIGHPDVANIIKLEFEASMLEIEDAVNNKNMQINKGFRKHVNAHFNERAALRDVYQDEHTNELIRHYGSDIFSDAGKGERAASALVKKFLSDPALTHKALEASEFVQSNDDQAGDLLVYLYQRDFNPDIAVGDKRYSITGALFNTFSPKDLNDAGYHAHLIKNSHPSARQREAFILCAVLHTVTMLICDANYPFQIGLDNDATLNLIKNRDTLKIQIQQALASTLFEFTDALKAITKSYYEDLDYHADQKRYALERKKTEFAELLNNPHLSNQYLCESPFIQGSRISFPYQYLSQHFPNLFQGDNDKEVRGEFALPEQSLVASVHLSELDNRFNVDVLAHLKTLSPWDTFFIMTTAASFYTHAASDSDRDHISEMLQALTVVEMQRITAKINHSGNRYIAEFISVFTKLETVEVGTIPGNQAFRNNKVTKLKLKLEQLNNAEANKECIEDMTKECQHAIQALNASKDVCLQYRAAHDRLSAYEANGDIEVEIKESALENSRKLEGSVSGDPVRHYAALSSFCLTALASLEKLRDRDENNQRANQEEHNRAFNEIERLRRLNEENQQRLSEAQQSLDKYDEKLENTKAAFKLVDTEYEKELKRNIQLQEELTAARNQIEGPSLQPKADRPPPPSYSPPTVPAKKHNTERNRERANGLVLQVPINPNGWRTWLPDIIFGAAILLGIAAVLMAALYTGGLILVPFASAVLVSHLTVTGFAVGGALIGAGIVGSVAKAISKFKSKKTRVNGLAQDSVPGSYNSELMSISGTPAKAANPSRRASAQHQNLFSTCGANHQSDHNNRLDNHNLNRLNSGGPGK